MKIMSRLLYNKILLPNTDTLEIIKSHNSITFYFIKRCMVHSSVLQIKYQKMEFTDPYFEKLAKDKHEELLPIVEKLQSIKLKHKNKILQNYLSFNICNSDLYIINSNESKKFVELIKDDLFKEMSHVIEVNPGFGLLTESLLKAGVPFLNVYEKNREFHTYLHDLNKKYSEKLKIKQANLFKIPRIPKEGDCATNASIEELLKDVPIKKWEESTCMQIIGTPPSNVFFQQLIISTLLQSNFMSYGRPSFYFAISPHTWNKLTINDSKLSIINILFNVLFNYKMFGTLDRNAFIPWHARISTVHKHINYHMLYVVKLEPKPNIHTIFGGKENLINFWYFVRHYFRYPKHRIIPALENQIPNCGIRLIKKNYNVFTEFGELKLTQIHDLFMELQSWPEYKTSTLALEVNEIKQIYNSHIEEENDCVK